MVEKDCIDDEIRQLAAMVTKRINAEIAKDADQRREELERRCRGIVENVLGRSATWTLRTDRMFIPAPNWVEIRDAFLKALFSIELEQTKNEVHSQYVVEKRD